MSSIDLLITMHDISPVIDYNFGILESIIILEFGQFIHIVQLENPVEKLSFFFSNDSIDFSKVFQTLISLNLIRSFSLYTYNYVNSRIYNVPFYYFTL